MGILADEYVRVRADTSSLSRDLKKEGVKSGKTFGTGFSGSLKGLIGGAAIFGVLAGATSLLKDASLAARDSWKVGRQTQAVLKSTGGAAKVTQREIEGLAGAISKKTGIDDEAIQSSANMLLTFTGVRNEVGKGNDIFTQATKTVTDMSVALGQDGKTSAIQLGKALNDPIAGVGALRRVGVQLTDQQKEQIKTLVEHGDKLGAQKVILRELSKEFGGSAAAQATWADKAKVSFENVQEVVGGFLNKTLEPVSKWFVEVGAPAIQDFFKTISTDKDLKTAITDLKSALTTLTGDPNFKQALTDIADALPGIVRGLAQVVTKFHQISGAIDEFENKSFGDGDKVGGPVGQIIKDFGSGGTIEQALIQFRQFTVRHVSQAWADMKASFAQRSAEAVAGVKGFVNQIVASFARLKTQVVTWVKRMWADAKASFIKNHSEILAGVGRWVAGVVKWASDMRARVVALVSQMWTKVKSLWTTAQTAVRTTWNNFWTGIKKVGSDAINSVRTTIDRVLGQIRTGFSRGVSAIGRAWDRIKSIARTPVAFVVNTVLDNGLLRAFRAISNLVGYSAGKNFHVSMARGGILPGYTPGKDVHRFVSATGGILDLSGGEPILRPELGRVLGKKRVDKANWAASHGRLREAQGYLGGFASGGFLGGTRPVPPGSTSQHSGYSWARWAGDLGAGMNTPVRAWKAGIIAAVRYLTTSYGRHIIENVGGSNVYYAHLARAVVRAGQSVRQGQVIGYSDSTGNSTGPHLHFEIRGGNAAIGSSSGGGGSILQALNPAKYLRMVTSALGKLSGIKNTPWGRMVAGIATKAADSVKGKIRSLAASFMGAGSSGAGFTSVSGGSNRAIGRRMMLQRWPASQWPALNSLWTKESGWRTNARNPSSGAYGIPQSLPASKMASAGSDWRTNPATQIKWGLGYISSRYGTPGAAWRHSQQTNWYGMGGVINEPVLGVGMRSGARYGFGERGPETVTPGRGGSRPITIILDFGDGLVQKIQSVIDDNDEFRATVGRTR